MPHYPSPARVCARRFLNFPSARSDWHLGSHPDIQRLGPSRCPTGFSPFKTARFRRKLSMPMYFRRCSCMSGNDGLNRRTLLRHAGAAAAAGAVGGVAPIAAAAPSAVLARGTRYNFDSVYSRIGTDSTKWDAQIAKFGKDSIAAGMGVADMDFRCAPFITEALKERIAHENWGYLSIPKSFPEAIVRWNDKRYGVTVNPANLEITTGVHPGLVAAIRAFSPR